MILCLLLLPGSLRAQTAPPLFETRAVWLATVLADGGWPQAGLPANEQEAKLRDIIQEMHSLGMNTLFFQVIARGDALYPSTRLPWSARPVEAGVSPGYDPLQVAIEESHRLGMELHAWVNVFRIGDSQTRSLFEAVENPQHITYSQPGWVKEVNNDLWLDPSLPEVRNWITENVIELVRDYDIDAIHFDFMRYPQTGFQDDQVSFDFDARGFTNIDDWRRDNVNLFARQAFEAIYRLKPWIKIGAAPLGNYRAHPDWPALLAFDDVFQASREWLQMGWFDYLAPQIYFSTGTTPETGNGNPSPDFEVLVQEWVAEAANRPIFAGMGIYKATENLYPASDIPAQIQAARSSGAAGHALFRYDDLLTHAPLITQSYQYPAISAPMSHRFEATPPLLREVTLEKSNDNVLSLNWLPATGTASDPSGQYLIFRAASRFPDTRSRQDLHVVLPAQSTSYTEALNPQDTTTIYYQVMARSRLGALSDPSPILSSAADPVSRQPEPGNATTQLKIFPNPVQKQLSILYTLTDPVHVYLTIFNSEGRRVSTLTEGRQQPGAYHLAFPVENLSPGVYYIAFAGTGFSETRAFTVIR